MITAWWGGGWAVRSAVRGAENVKVHGDKPDTQPDDKERNKSKGVLIFLACALGYDLLRLVAHAI